MDPSSIEQFGNAGVQFIRLADPPATILILILTFIILRTVWVPRHYRIDSLAWVALLIAVPITSLCSVSEEINWGGRFFWRAVLQNGAVSVMVAFLALPRLYKRWPGLLDDKPLFLSDLQLKHILTYKGDSPPLEDASFSEKKKDDDQQRKDIS